MKKLENIIKVMLLSGACIYSPEAMKEQIGIIAQDKVSIFQRYENSEGTISCIVEYPATDFMKFQDRIIIKYGIPIYYPPEKKAGEKPSIPMPKLEKEVYKK